MATSPVPVLQRKVSAQSGSTPDFHAATESLANAEGGGLAAIGATVAQSASNQMATQLGFEQGKTPNGDLGPAITDFDKNFKDSYEQQAHATLSLQGQKLIDDTHIQMSQANRMTPQLIQHTTEQLQTGLTNIASNAPTGVKQKLQEQFDSNVLNVHTQYSEKLAEQNRQDQKDTLQDGIDVAVKNAMELGKNGDVKGSNAAAASAAAMAANGHANGFYSKEQTRVAAETAKQAALNGQYSHDAIMALKDKKYEQFADDYSKKDPKSLGMTNEQYQATGEAFSREAAFIQGLRTQNDNLKSQQMRNQIVTDPNAITGTQWQEYVDSVPTLQSEQMKFHYIQALKQAKGANGDVDLLMKNFSNPEAWANATDKTRDGAYNKSVEYAQQQAAQDGKSLSRDEAQVQVAASAGGPISVFTKELKNQLHSANPAQMDSAAMKIHMLDAMGAGHATAGLNDEDKALYTAYESLKSSQDPVTAARDANTAVLGQDPEVQLANKQKWSNMMTANTAGGVTPVKFALTKFGMKESKFINPSMAQVYGADILRKYSTFYQLLNGDDANATKLTQQYVDNNYGTTGVNGGSYQTLHPLEKVAGFQSSDGIPYIQQDAASQIAEKFQNMKKLYDNKKSDEYWEVEPVTGAKHGIFSTTYDPIKITMKTRDGKSNTYPVILQGNAFDNWDVAIQTSTGMRNLHQVAPYLGVISYTPNVKSIQDSYNKQHTFATENGTGSKLKKGASMVGKKITDLLTIPDHAPNEAK